MVLIANEFDLLYAQPNPGAALRAWALSPHNAALVAGGGEMAASPDPALAGGPRPATARSCTSCGGTGVWAKGLCHPCYDLARKHPCDAPGCTTLITPKARYCVRHAPRDRAGRVPPEVSSRPAAPAAPPPSAPAPRSRAPGAPPTPLRLTPGLATTCPASADGRHRLLPFGGLALPGQPTHYCSACQPRPVAHRMLAHAESGP